MSARFVAFVIASTIYIPLMLIADTRGLAPQLALGLATAAFLFIFLRRGVTAPRQIITAIVVATIGECVLSLGWGLYSYRNALIPLYVPVGHGVFYLLAAESARQSALQRIGPAITRSVVAIGTLIAIVSLVYFRDQWGFLWWLIAATLIWRSANQLLLSTCFIYTILLEWLGTAIGNWHWAARVPLLGLTSANPPSGVGVLYILLDLITVALCAASVRPYMDPADRARSAYARSRYRRSPATG